MVQFDLTDGRVEYGRVWYSRVVYIYTRVRVE